jgi:hypothetical protein
VSHEIPSPLPALSENVPLSRQIELRHHTCAKGFQWSRTACTSNWSRRGSHGGGGRWAGRRAISITLALP